MWKWWLVVGLFVGIALWRAMRRETDDAERLQVQRSSGMIEPPSLHPVIDPHVCIGCGSCVDACPEKTILGLIDGKAELVEPTRCIGHGACRTACPTEAIDLVFGSERRGVDIPFVDPKFQTNVPGIFIAGELGGMGLIRNAFSQATQAIDAIAALKGLGQDGRLDVVIVGAGPAGVAAALSCVERGLRYVVVEQDALGGTIAHYPRGKIVMTSPAHLPRVGKLSFRETTKEILVEFFENIFKEHQLDVQFGQAVSNIDQQEDGFLVHGTSQSWSTRSVLLAIGRRGTPRKLGVPGEEASKVVYRLDDPESQAGRSVLVVGGGDSALETAIALAETEGTRVDLAYRSDAFSRAKQKNRERVEELRESGRLAVHLETVVAEITAELVVLEPKTGDRFERPNDSVIVCAGGVLPTPFLEKIGIRIDTKFGKS